MSQSHSGVIIFGATGPTGTRVTRALCAAGIPVAAVMRSAERVDEFTALGATVCHADAMQTETLRPLLDSTVGTFPILLNLLGGNPFEDPSGWPDFQGVVNVTEAACAAGYKRCVLVTTVGTGASWPYVPDAEGFLVPIIKLKNQAEQHLKQTSLDWTILKPGGLGPPDYRHERGTALITENHGVRGLIDREDLAEVITLLLAADPARIRHRELYAVAQNIEQHAGDALPFKM